MFMGKLSILLLILLAGTEFNFMKGVKGKGFRQRRVGRHVCNTNDAGFRCEPGVVNDMHGGSVCSRCGGYDTPWCFDTRRNGSWDYCSNCDPTHLDDAWLNALSGCPLQRP